jgi:hypothetical protein
VTHRVRVSAHVRGVQLCPPPLHVVEHEAKPLPSSVQCSLHVSGRLTQSSPHGTISV